MSQERITLINHYESLFHEYSADLERRVMIAKNKEGDAFGAFDRMIGVMVSELARLKVQLADLDLKVSRRPDLVSDTPLRPSLNGTWPSMPIYGAGDTISIGGGLSSYGFHAVEFSAGDYVHRWSGPSVRCGFVAQVERSEPLVAEAYLDRIDNQIEVDEVEVDGEVVQHEFEAGALRFSIPPIVGAGVAATHVSIKLNQTKVISDVRPGVDDSRRVGVDVSTFRLSRFEPPVEENTE